MIESPAAECSRLVQRQSGKRGRAFSGIVFADRVFFSILVWNPPVSLQAYTKDCDASLLRHGVLPTWRHSLS